jgi:hypothetical protein
MEIEFINTKYVFSLYKNLKTVKQPEAKIDINQLIEAIRYGYLRKIIEKLRDSTTNESYDLIKLKSIPCVTVSGIFGYRNDEGIIKHSGLMQVDIDTVDDFDALFKKVCNDRYTYVCFRSPGGKGLKAIVKVNPSPDTHRDQFKALEGYYEKQFGVEIDKQCINLSRCMLLSYDPYIFCNPHSDVFEEVYIHPEISKDHSKKEVKGTLGKKQKSDDPHELIENIITSLEREHIDITSSYSDWIKVGFALCSTFGEGGRDYFRRLSRLYPRYSHKETDAKYTELLSRNDGSTKLGSIVYMAQQAGVKVGRRYR